MAPVHTLCRCWRDTTKRQRLGSYELLSGSDILYEPQAREAMAGVLPTTLTPQGVALFADPGREGVAEFFQHLAAGGFRVQVRRRQLRWLASRQEVWLYQVTRTRARTRHA